VISIAPDEFAEHMRLLAASGTRVVPLAQAGCEPNTAAITFDDGFRSVYEYALPVLREHGFSATVFVVSGYCGRRNDWPSQTPGIPRMELMNWEEIRTSSRCGMTAGCHTVTHPDLTSCSATEIDVEFGESVREIESRTHNPVDTVAYPYGRINTEVVKSAERYFKLACATRLAYLGGENDPMQLPRLDTYYLRAASQFERLPRRSGELYIAGRARLRELRQLLRPTRLRGRHN
jgi:peptidoglycan/xylan/chitin deacetylase (PgdA/CDA1 family)